MARASMRCDEVRAVLPAYAGEDDPYPHDLEVHLQVCRGCANEETRYREVLGVVRGLRDEGELAPEELSARVAQRAARPDVAWRGYARRVTYDPASRYAAVGIGGVLVGVAAAVAFLVRRSARRAPAAKPRRRPARGRVA